VAVDKDADTEIAITFKVDLKKFANNILLTIKDLNRYYDEEYSQRDEEYEKCRKAIEDGKVVLMGSFEDQSGDDGERFLCDNGLKGIVDEDEITIIYNEAGY